MKTMSATGRRPSTSRLGRGRWSRGAAARAAGASGGFTLLEVVLAVSLLLLLSGLAVINFAGWAAGSALPEGADAFQTVLRMARADAANQGRRLRLAFGEAGPQLLWEPQPLTEPGTFTEYGCTWRDRIPTGLVRVTRCQLTDPSGWAAEAPAAEGQATLQAITFNPDGSCDSALIELTSLAEEGGSVVLDLDGATGAVSVRAADEDAAGP